jgi:uncharacterized RDD family membrane protein YckC
MAKLQAGDTQPRFPPMQAQPAPPPPEPTPAVPMPAEPPPSARPPAPALARTEAWASAPTGNPPPPFLQAYLPPVPDDAKPVMFGGGIERGGFGVRFLAWLIDGVVGIVFQVVAYIGFIIISIASKGLACILFPILGLLGLGYLIFQLWCMVRFRATLGKKVMKLRVVPALNPTGNIDWGMAILRVVGHFVSGVLCFLPYLLILGSERKGLQDMFSGSVVIKVDR